MGMDRGQRYFGATMPGYALDDQFLMYQLAREDEETMERCVLSFDRLMCSIGFGLAESYACVAQIRYSSCGQSSLLVNW